MRERCPQSLDAELACALADLERVRALVREASERLLPGFRKLAAAAQDRDALNEVIAALQFEDLATQALDHVGARLRKLATAPERPEPAAAQLSPAGSAELFH